MNVELEVVAIDVNNNIDSVDCWYDSPVSECLSRERHTQLKLDLLKVDFRESRCNEDGLLETEVLGQEGSSEV